MARGTLRKALERMARATGGPFRFETTPPTRHAMWEARGTFYMPPGTTYDDLGPIFAEWEQDKVLTRMVGKRRTARIQVQWAQGRGKSGEYTLAEIGTWDFALGRATERVDVRDGDRDSLSERYGRDGKTSSIMRIYVWLGSDVRSVDGLDF